MLSAFNPKDETEQVKEKKRFGFLRKRSKTDDQLEADSRDDYGTDDTREQTGFFKKIQKAAVYKQFSDDPKAVLEVEQADGLPELPSKDHVVVKVQASTVSYNDCLLRRGMCFSVMDPVCLPATPGMDVVGYIVALGENVTEWKERDRVAALVQTGGNARYAVIHQQSLISVPRSMDASEAACVVSTYMTAYQTLKMCVRNERTLDGKQVLVTGGVGIQGQALIQMARRAGAAKVYATAPKNMHRYVRLMLGAKPLPMEPEEWLPQVEGQMDFVLDGVCQDGFESPRRALSSDSDSMLICVGMTALLNSEKMGAFGAPMSAHWSKTKASWFMSRTKFYDIWSSFKNDPKQFKIDLLHVFTLLQRRDIKPHIAKRVSLSEIAEAHVYLELGKARGAIVCLPWKRTIVGTVRAGEYGEEED